MENKSRKQSFTREGQNALFMIRYENRFPIQQRRSDGSWGCRGCGGSIPKGRQTWCSQQCVDTYDPRRVIFFAKQRDKEICSECGYDYPKAYREWWALRERARIQLDYTAWKQWLKGEPPKIEYDHIKPFSEGGLTVLENIRSLCSVCHKVRTKRWHRERKQDATLSLEFASIGAVTRSDNAVGVAAEGESVGLSGQPEGEKE